MSVSQTDARKRIIIARYFLETHKKEMKKKYVHVRLTDVSTKVACIPLSSLSLSLLEDFLDFILGDFLPFSFIEAKVVDGRF